MNLLMRSKKVLLPLFLVFIAPGIFAILFYMHPSWLGGLPTNKGLLIRPSVPLAALDGSEVESESATEKDKWHMVVWCPKGCDTTCLHTLDEMARVRLALGRRLYQVDLWMLQAKQSLVCSHEATEAFKAGAIKKRELSKKAQEEARLLTNKPKVFLADPRHYLVLEYEALGKPSDVFQDLKRLLNTREQA